MLINNNKLLLMIIKYRFNYVYIVITTIKTYLRNIKFGLKHNI